MLESIFSGMSGGISGMLDFIVQKLLSMLNFDMERPLLYMPIIATFYDILQWVALGLIGGIAVFQLGKFFFGNLAESKDTPVRILVRTAIASGMVYVGNYGLQLIFDLFSYPMSALLDTNATISGALFADIAKLSLIGSIGGLGGILLTLILLCALGWNLLKLLLEAVERWLMLCVLTYTSPLAYATIASQATFEIFRKFLSMTIGQSVLLLANVWSVKILINILAGISVSAEPAEMLFGFIVAFAFSRIAQKIDSYLQQLGINAATTGGSLLDTLAAVGSVGSGLFGGRGRGAGNSPLGAAMGAAASGLGNAIKAGNIMKGAAFGGVGGAAASFVGKNIRKGATAAGMTAGEYVKSKMKNAASGAYDKATEAMNGLSPQAANAMRQTKAAASAAMGGGKDAREAAKNAGLAAAEKAVREGKSQEEAREAGMTAYDKALKENAPLGEKTGGMFADTAKNMDAREQFAKDIEPAIDKMQNGASRMYVDSNGVVHNGFGAAQPDATGRMPPQNDPSASDPSAAQPNVDPANGAMGAENPLDPNAKALQDALNGKDSTAPVPPVSEQSKSPLDNANGDPNAEAIRQAAQQQQQNANPANSAMGENDPSVGAPKPGQNPNGQPITPTSVKGAPQNSNQSQKDAADPNAAELRKAMQGQSNINPANGATPDSIKTTPQEASVPSAQSSGKPQADSDPNKTALQNAAQTAQTSEQNPNDGAGVGVMGAGTDEITGSANVAAQVAEQEALAQQTDGEQVERAALDANQQNNVETTNGATIPGVSSATATSTSADETKIDGNPPVGRAGSQVLEAVNANQKTAVQTDTAAATNLNSAISNATASGATTNQTANGVQTSPVGAAGSRVLSAVNAQQQTVGGVENAVAASTFTSGSAGIKTNVEGQTETQNTEIAADSAGSRVLAAATAQSGRYDSPSGAVVSTSDSGAIAVPNANGEAASTTTAGETVLTQVSASGTEPTAPSPVSAGTTVAADADGSSGQSINNTSASSQSVSSPAQDTSFTDGGSSAESAGERVRAAATAQNTSAPTIQGPTAMVARTIASSANSQAAAAGTGFSEYVKNPDPSAYAADGQIAPGHSAQVLSGGTELALNTITERGSEVADSIIQSDAVVDNQAVAVATFRNSSFIKGMDADVAQSFSAMERSGTIPAARDAVPDQGIEAIPDRGSITEMRVGKGVTEFTYEAPIPKATGQNVVVSEPERITVRTSAAFESLSTQEQTLYRATQTEAGETFYMRRMPVSKNTPPAPELRMPGDQKRSFDNSGRDSGWNRGSNSGGRNPQGGADSQSGGSRSNQQDGGRRNGSQNGKQRNGNAGKRK